MKIYRSLQSWLQRTCLLLLPLLPTTSAATAPDSTGIPQWVLDDWAEQTRAGGVWIADNSAYKNAGEPFDAYGIQWEWGLGKKSVKGRLFCLRDGQDVGSVWQFLSFWDPWEGKIRVIQIGSDGTVGEGFAWKEADGSAKSMQRFAGPDGSHFESGHREWTENGARHTQSYDIADGVWTERRFYVWKLKAD